MKIYRVAAVSSAYFVIFSRILIGQEYTWSLSNWTIPVINLKFLIHIFITSVDIQFFFHLDSAAYLNKITNNPTQKY